MKTCIECGTLIPFYDAIPIRMGKKTAYMCSRCYRRGSMGLMARGYNPIKVYEVTITQGMIRPRGGVRSPFERTLTVRAKSARAAMKAVRDAGYQATKVEVVEVKEKNPLSLYQSFHGNPPAHTRKIKFDVPKPNEPLVKIGRLSELKYMPEFPSRHEGVEFYHFSGDTGERMLKSNLILATNMQGTQLYLIKDKKGKHPFFSSRGIIG